MLPHQIDPLQEAATGAELAREARRRAVGQVQTPVVVVHVVAVEPVLPVGERSQPHRERTQRRASGTRGILHAPKPEPRTQHGDRMSDQQRKMLVAGVRERIEDQRVESTRRKNADSADSPAPDAPSTAR